MEFRHLGPEDPFHVLGRELRSCISGERGRAEEEATCGRVRTFVSSGRGQEDEDEDDDDDEVQRMNLPHAEIILNLIRLVRRQPAMANFFAFTML